MIRSCEVDNYSLVVASEEGGRKIICTVSGRNQDSSSKLTFVVIMYNR